MTDKDKLTDDEYQFEDVNMDIEPDSGLYTESEAEVLPEENRSKNTVMRNALLAVAGLITLMLVYRFVVSFFSDKPKPEPIKPVVVQKIDSQLAAAPVLPPVETPKVVVDDTIQKKFDQKMNELEMNQINLRTDLNTVNDQMLTVNQTISALTKQMEALNQTVVALSDKVSAESAAVIAFTEKMRPKPKPISRATIKRAPRLRYYIQAIIPGRAWLLASNGSTLTVREGSPIPGYGVVRLVDAIQGRVLLSSGRVIEFSQQDS